jgi:hypothetical protein
MIDTMRAIAAGYRHSQRAALEELKICTDTDFRKYLEAHARQSGCEAVAVEESARSIRLLG